MREIPVLFECEGESLVGICHATETPGPAGVLVVAGGPQYRIGSHRQFLLIARDLADRGIPVFRLDYRGMGDSGGPYRGFEHIGTDIRAGIDAFLEKCPNVARLILLGLCDAATANVFYAPDDSRVAGLVVINPWVRTPAGSARSFLRHYYLRRLGAKAFWLKLLRGRVNPFAVLLSMASLRRQASGAPPQEEAPPSPAEAPPPGDVCLPAPPNDPAPLPKRFLRAARQFEGPILLITSERDLTAMEFLDSLGGLESWHSLQRSGRVVHHTLPKADHTFSRAHLRATIVAHICAWIAQIGRNQSAAGTETANRETA